MTGFAKRGEDFLTDLNRALRLGEDGCSIPHTVTQRPVAFVIGAPRSGTTLLTQWLADSGDFAVPTNLLARLPQAPYLGGLLQRLLTDPDLDYRGELAVRDHGAYASEAGKTVGLLAPHEFFYFWRRFFSLDVARPMTASERSEADVAGFGAGLARLEHALESPLAMKAIIAQYDLDLILEAVPSAVFLLSRRDEVDNVESLLRVRAKVHGSEGEWFSVRPDGSERLEDQPPVVQAAAQVAWTNDDLEAQVSTLAAEHLVRVDHAGFCAAPHAVHAELARCCGALGHRLNDYQGPRSFDEHRRSSPRAQEIREALEYVRSIRRGEE